MNDRTMGQRVAQCRKELNLSQEALGDKLGVSRQAISKWEADAAVPEIDKLIALSRLFGVSVGWLLGVEEKSPPQEEDLSDTQLKMVEEIVKRYQPARETAAEKKLRIISILLVAAVAIAALIFSFNGKRDAPANNSEQLSSLQASYSGIQSQLSDIGARLDALEAVGSRTTIYQNPQSQPEQEQLLLSYQFRIDGLDEAGDTAYVADVPTGEVLFAVDIPTAAISFTAVPKQHSETDTAYLMVFLDGSEFQKVDCRWNDASYTAELNLWIIDGYEICFTLCRGDGTQEQQVLENGNIENLEKSIYITLTAEPGKAKYVHFEDHDQLTPVGFDGYVKMPAYYVDTDVALSAFGYALYLNGEELGRVHRGENDTNLSSAGAASEYWFYIGSDSFELPVLQEGDRVELRVYAQLGNGASAERTAGLWLYTDGRLEQQTFDAASSQVNRFGS